MLPAWTQLLLELVADDTSIDDLDLDQRRAGWDDQNDDRLLLLENPRRIDADEENRPTRPNERVFTELGTKFN